MKRLIKIPRITANKGSSITFAPWEFVGWRKRCVSNGKPTCRLHRAETFWEGKKNDCSRLNRRHNSSAVPPETIDPSWLSAGLCMIEEGMKTLWIWKGENYSENTLWVVIWPFFIVMIVSIFDELVHLFLEEKDTVKVEGWGQLRIIEE